MDQIFIKDLLVRGIIGVSERERQQPQDIIINITLLADTTQGGLSDDIDDCVNYRTVTKEVYAFVEKAQRHTVEALAADIAGLCLKQAGVKGARVQVEKPGAVRFSRSVGVEIERFNPD
jgi:FolB domain-containing protein